MDIKELKVMAYDTLAQIEMLQGRMKEINQAIGQEMSKQKEQEEEVKKALDATPMPEEPKKK